VAAGAITAYQAGASGAGVTVGIIDSGIAANNPEFTGRISSASRDFAGNRTIEDEGGHGTAVATVLAGGRNNNLILGMAWGATILALRTDSPGTCASTDPSKPDSGCSHNDSAITAALDHARINGAKVVNISLGGDGGAPPSLLAAIDRATAAGMVIVIAAGNDMAAAPDAFAASFASNPAIARGQIIIAASVNANGVHSDFSNGALGFESTTLSALGSRVLSQDQNGDTFLWSGTSFSAPQIAGAAALLAQAFPNLTGAQIVDLLLSSARDAGATGADSVFGRGILNVAGAFAPRGSTSLAGSTTPVSLTANGSLSAPMGDASEVGSLSAVALDSMKRAYTLNLKPTLQSDLPGLTLAPALQIQRQSINVQNGPVSVSLSLAPGRGSGVEARRLMLSPEDAQQACALSGAITMRLAEGTTMALGFSEGAASLSTRIDTNSAPAFLIAGDSHGAIGFDRVAGSGMALRQRVAPGIALTATAEQGHAWRQTRTPTESPWGDNRDGYAAVGVGAEGQTGPLTLSLNATYMREESTLLGARFGSAVGALAGRTLFLDSKVTLDGGDGWRMGASVRQGWTGGGGANMRTNAWSLDGEKQGVLERNDRLALRVSQPLRVASGGIALTLPTGYDYATQTTTFTRETLGLVPRGREIDAEAVYARPVGSGWLTLNSYWRKDSGNLSWFPDDIGGALRYSLDF
jgi:hypothetical protein